MATWFRPISALTGTILWLFYSQVTLSQSGQYQTFGFNKFESTVLSPYQLVHVNKENAQYIRLLIKSELEAQGMSLHSSPDLLINIGITITQEFQSRRIDGTKRWIPPYSKEEEQYIIQEGVYAKVGTIKVEFRKAGNNKIVWDGARSMTLWGKNEKRLRKNTEKAITKIFKKFDPDAIALD